MRNKGSDQVKNSREDLHLNIITLKWISFQKARYQAIKPAIQYRNEDTHDKLKQKL